MLFFNITPTSTPSNFTNNFTNIIRIKIEREICIFLLSTELDDLDCDNDGVRGDIRDKNGDGESPLSGGTGFEAVKSA